MLPCFLETYLDLKADRSLQNLDARSVSVPYLLPTVLTTASATTLTSTFDGLKSLGAQLLLQPRSQGSGRLEGGYQSHRHRTAQQNSLLCQKCPMATPSSVAATIPI